MFSELGLIAQMPAGFMGVSCEWSIFMLLMSYMNTVSSRITTSRLRFILTATTMPWNVSSHIVECLCISMSMHAISLAPTLSWPYLSVDDPE